VEAKTAQKMLAFNFFSIFSFGQINYTLEDVLLLAGPPHYPNQGGEKGVGPAQDFELPVQWILLFMWTTIMTLGNN
jgi:hypothetical protein